MTGILFKAPVASHMPITGEVAFDTTDSAIKIFNGNQWIEVAGVNTVAKQFEVIDKADVDGEMWYTVKCTNEIGDWVRTQPAEQWVSNRSWLLHENNFDMHRELFAFLKLTWS